MYIFALHVIVHSEYAHIDRIASCAFWESVF